MQAAVFYVCFRDSVRNSEPQSPFVFCEQFSLCQEAGDNRLTGHYYLRFTLFFGDRELSYVLIP
jgi:hypothetical protein